MTPELVNAFGAFGPTGLMILYLVWDKSQQRAVDLARAESDKAIAASLAALTVVVQAK